MMSNHFSNDATPKAYAKNQVNEVWSIEKFAKHIADHNGVYSRGTVKGVLSDMCECLVEQLLNGNKIVTIYISIHHLNRLYLKAIQEMLKIRND